MKTQHNYLVYFPYKETGLGIIPAHLMAVSDIDLNQALAHGGKDVSRDTDAWAQYERELNEEYMSP